MIYIKNTFNYYEYSYYNPIIKFLIPNYLWKINRYFLFIELLFLFYIELFFYFFSYGMVIIWLKPLLCLWLFYDQRPKKSFTMDFFLDENKFLKWLFSLELYQYIFIKMLLFILFFIMIIWNCIKVFIYYNNQYFHQHILKLTCFLFSLMVINYINSWIIYYYNWHNWINILKDNHIIV